jgi:hypothetical protein
MNKRYFEKIKSKKIDVFAKKITPNKKSSQQPFQLHHPFFPVVHFFGLKVDEFLGMIAVNQVAQFVDKNVFNSHRIH